MNDNMKSTNTFSSSSLPSWLQQYKDENRNQTDTDQEFDKIKDLSKKWNSICKSVHRQPHFLEKMFNFSSLSPSSSDSISSNSKHNSKLHRSLLEWRPTTFEPNQSLEEHQFFLHANEGEVSKPVIKPDLLSNPNSSPNSASSSDASGDHMDFLLKFKEFNSENMNILCNALEKKVPWQRDIIPDIATPRDDSTEEVSNKRARDEHGGSYFDRFADAVRDNPGRVFLLEDVDQIDYHSRKGIKRSIENGSITLSNGEIVPLKDAIIIFSCENFSLESRACSPRTEQKYDKIKKDQEKGKDLKQ
ncbi:Double Clp-N motif-containing P-loop nucleoside triphosphate hydrolase superfamily protein [Abeliophyllum distichum]|uniref:Double Clp-N motif-containing P-loop nucleoside triphosphate hydrolase superfamily protein n=1 Tax=Abeliophyllum distichum TaxID=126358 RepID=A0ABD1U293_9LAMI